MVVSSSEFDLVDDAARLVGADSLGRSHLPAAARGRPDKRSQCTPDVPYVCDDVQQLFALLSLDGPRRGHLPAIKMPNNAMPQQIAQSHRGNRVHLDAVAIKTNRARVGLFGRARRERPAVNLRRVTTTRSKWISVFRCELTDAALDGAGDIASGRIVVGEVIKESRLPGFRDGFRPIVTVGNGRLAPRHHERHV